MEFLGLQALRTYVKLAWWLNTLFSIKRVYHLNVEIEKAMYQKIESEILLKVAELQKVVLISRGIQVWQKAV